MNDIAVAVRGLSKSYVIAHNATKHTTLTEAIAHRVKNPLQRPEKETFWALKDIEFDVKKGDVVGIIGHNGAGKSTLLKILSQITEPTTGEVRLYGRVGSLLEVGTGFHPELTGRENIYLNGAILGMRKREIERQFDEIVDFAEVEQFLDTPVKRYSSGMYVRLAFAVAAHLNPEILVVDEVLSVGDAQFQKKCLGKMQDVSQQEGKTILFVSHNMSAVRTLCTRAIVFKNGKITLEGHPSEVISSYLSLLTTADSDIPGQISWDNNCSDAPVTEEIRLQRVNLVGPTGSTQDIFEADKEIQVEIYYEVRQVMRGLRFTFQIMTEEGDIAFVATDAMFRNGVDAPGLYKSICKIPGKLLNRRRYLIGIGCDIPGVKVILFRRDYLKFSVSGAGNQSSLFPESWPGIVCPAVSWEIESLSHSS